MIGEKPKRQGPRPLTPPMQKELKKNIDEMLEVGIIRPSTSEYASPVVLVRKNDGSIHFCVDFRLLNKVTRPISYLCQELMMPRPHSEELYTSQHSTSSKDYFKWRWRKRIFQKQPHNIVRSVRTRDYAIRPKE